MVSLPFAQVDGNCNLAPPITDEPASAWTEPVVGLSPDCCPCQSFTLSGPFVPFEVEGSGGWSSAYSFASVPAPAYLGFVFQVSWSTASPGTTAGAITGAFTRTPSAFGTGFTGVPLPGFDPDNIETWETSLTWCMDGSVSCTLRFDGVDYMTVGVADASTLFGTCAGFDPIVCSPYTILNNPALVGVDVDVTVSVVGPDTYEVTVDDYQPAGILTDPSAPNTPTGVAIYGANCILPDAPWKMVQEWSVFEEDPGNPGTFDQPYLLTTCQATTLYLGLVTSGAGYMSTAGFLVEDRDYGCEELNDAVTAMREGLERLVATYGDGVTFTVQNQSQLPWQVKTLLAGPAYGSFFDVDRAGFGTINFGFASTAEPALASFSCRQVSPTPTVVITIGPLELSFGTPPGSI